jgi:hypothetical protein
MNVSQVLVTHVCNPSSDQEDHRSKPALGKIVRETLFRKNPSQKKDWQRGSSQSQPPKKLGMTDVSHCTQLLLLNLDPLNLSLPSNTIAF